MQRGLQRLRELAEPARIADTAEMFMSNDLYYALARAGFEVVMIDGRQSELGWRQASYLYDYEPSPNSVPPLFAERRCGNSGLGPKLARAGP